MQIESSDTEVYIISFCNIYSKTWNESIKMRIIFQFWLLHLHWMFQSTQMLRGLFGPISQSASGTPNTHQAFFDLSPPHSIGKSFHLSCPSSSVATGRNISAMCFREGTEAQHRWKHIELYLTIRLTFAKHFPAAPCYLQLPIISKLCIFRTLFCMIDFLYIVETRTTLQILYLSFFLRKCKVYIQLTNCCENLFQ